MKENSDLPRESRTHLAKWSEKRGVPGGETLQSWLRGFQAGRHGVGRGAKPSEGGSSVTAVGAGRDGRKRAGRTRVAGSQQGSWPPSGYRTEPSTHAEVGSRDETLQGAAPGLLGQVPAVVLAWARGQRPVI